MTTIPRMTNLFLQLGLAASEEAIAKFIGSRRLAAGDHNVGGRYGTEGQRQFIDEKLEIDGNWTTIVDQLNESLHEDAVKQQTEGK